MALRNLAREEPLWWMKGLKPCNGKKIQQREPHVIIQTNETKKSWGHTAKEFIQGGNGFLYKFSRVTGIKICNPSFHEEFAPLDHSCSSGQQSCSGISVEDGTRNPQVLKVRKLKLELKSELSTILSDHNYFRVPSKQVGCQSRLRVQDCNRLVRLET